MCDELRLTGLRKGVVIGNCMEKLAYFCEHDAYQFYDLVGYRYIHETDRFRPELLSAVNRAMFARSSVTAWQPFLDSLLPELAAIPIDTDLVESPDRDYEIARELLLAYYARMSAVKWITDMAASKMLYLKRPCLAAISDSYVREVLGIRVSELENESQYACRALATSDAVRTVGKANIGVLDHMQSELQPLISRLGEQQNVNAFISKTRIIDVLIWVDMAINANHRMWTPQAKAKGWSTIFDGGRS